MKKRIIMPDEGEQGYLDSGWKRGSAAHPRPTLGLSHPGAATEAQTVGLRGVAAVKMWIGSNISRRKPSSGGSG